MSDEPKAPKSKADIILLVLALVLGALSAFVFLPRLEKMNDSNSLYWNLFGGGGQPGEFWPPTEGFEVAGEGGLGPAFAGGAADGVSPVSLGPGGSTGGPAGGASAGQGTGPIDTGGSGGIPGEPGGGPGGPASESPVPESPGPEGPAPESPEPEGPGPVPESPEPEGPGPGPGPVGPGPGAGGPGAVEGAGGGGPAGCAVQCITQALVTPSLGTPDMGLDVKTTIEARIKVDLSTQPNLINPAGDDGTPGYVTEWSTLLDGLEWDTLYHIRVWAEDLNGNTAWRVGTVRTPEQTAAPGGGFVNPQGGSGCSFQCIESALLYPIESSPNLELRVSTSELTRLRMYVSEQAPQYNQQGEPFFPGAQPLASTQEAYTTSWITILPLEYGTNYHGIVSATDGDGRTQYRAGTFSTGKPAGGAPEIGEVVIGFHEVHVTNDADQGNNPGELRFRFQIDDDPQPDLNTAQESIRSPVWGDFGPNRWVSIADPPSVIDIAVQGIEWDPGGLSLLNLCAPPAGGALYPSVSGREEHFYCYGDYEWNTAVATIDLDSLGVPPEGQKHTGPCAGADPQASCILLKAEGADPAFELYVSILRG